MATVVGNAQRSRLVRNVLTALWTLPLLAGGAALGAGELFVSAWKCDEGCSGWQPGDSWTGNVDAWQWGLIGACGVAGFIAIVVASGLAFARRPRAALIAYGVGALAFLIPWGMLH